MYARTVVIVAFLRALLRRLRPPGNRGSLETEYRQANPDNLDMGSHPRGFGQRGP
jgi:hypothetical protein